VFELSRSKPYFSIIICTKYADLLEECLDAIIFDISRSGESYEVIIVAHRCASLLAHGITQKYAIKSVNIKYMVQDGDGLPNARNCGIKVSRGMVIVFMDDDIIVERGYFRRLKKMLSRDGKIGGVSGVFETYSLVPRKFRCIKAILDKLFIGSSYGDGGAIGKVFPSGFSTLNFGFVTEVTEVDRLSGCNMAYPREVMSKCGLFDENFEGGYAAGEDADYSFRVKKLGKKLLVDPTLKLKHRHMEIKDPFSATRVYFGALNHVYFFFKNVYDGKAYSIFQFVRANIYTFTVLLIGGLLYRRPLTGIFYYRGILMGIKKSKGLLLRTKK